MAQGKTFTLNYSVTNMRTGKTVAAFMLRTDAERYISTLHSREGVNGPIYVLQIPVDELI